MIFLSIILEAVNEGLLEKIILVAVGAGFGQVSAVVLYLLNKNQNKANVGKTEADINKTDAETIQILQNVISDLQTKLQDWIERFSDGKRKAIEEIEKLEDKLNDLQSECAECFRDKKGAKQLFTNLNMFFNKLESALSSEQFLPFLNEMKQFQAEISVAMKGIESK